MKRTKKQNRTKRRLHIRKSISGTAQKPRVYVFKSNKYLYAAVTNDEDGKVLFGQSANRTIKGAEELGKKVAALLKKKKLTEAVFDRSGYKYHGVVSKYVDSLRDNGIKI